MTVRKELENRLRNGPVSLYELVRQTGEPPEDLKSDLDHLIKTLRHSGGQRIEVEPARCRKCGFAFSEDHLTKPTKCPQCTESWISEPRFRVVTTES